MPVHNMHEAQRSRATIDAENKRTGDSIFRAAISSASSERTSRLWARADFFEPLGATRAEPLEHSAALGWLERHLSSTQHPGAESNGTHRAFCVFGMLTGRLDRLFSSILRFWGGLARLFRAVCSSEPGSSSQMHQITHFSSQGGGPEASESEAKARGPKAFLEKI